MTIIEKLSDRGGFIYEAILIITNNNSVRDIKTLQYKLFQCGVYVKKPLLVQAISVMKEKKLIVIDEEKDHPTTEAAVQP